MQDDAPGELIPISVVRPIIEQWVAKFEDKQQAYLLLESNSGTKADTWRFRLSDGTKTGKTRNGKSTYTSYGWFALEAIDWADVDEFLAAADATYLWRSTDLADFLPDNDSGWHDAEHDKWCAECGRTVDWERGDLGVRVELGETVNVRKRWSWWTLCALCAAEKLPHGKSGTAKLTDDELLRLYRAYVLEELSVTIIADRVWKRHGFKSPNAAAAAIQQAWKRWGWPTRKRAVTKSLQRKHGRRLGHKIPIADVRKLHVLHTRGERLSALELSRRLHAKYGYNTPQAMHRAMLDAWKVLGLKARDRIEMTVEMSRKNGLSPRDARLRRRLRAEAGLNVHTMQPLRPICTGKTQRGRPCGHRSLQDSDKCWSHDPRFDEERRSQAAAMRSRSPLHDPARLEPWEPLRVELERYFAITGSWKHLEQVSDYGRSTLSSFKGDTVRQRIDRLKAARLRRAIREAYELAGVDVERLAA